MLYNRDQLWVLYCSYLISITYPIAQKNYPSVYLLMIQNNMVFECDNLHHLESIMNEKLNSVFKYFNINKLAKILIKAGFFMIADDQGLQIADCKESCFHIIADDRERSQSRLLPTFRSAEVSKLQVLCACGKIASKQHSLATKSSQVFQLAFLISNLCLMDCVQYVD